MRMWKALAVLVGFCGATVHGSYAKANAAATADTSGGDSAVAETIDTDLKPLIRDAAKKPLQFAVDLPHSVSVETAGRWARDGDTAIWSYEVHIPTAVSMSFHADVAQLPGNAVLRVLGGGQSYLYQSRDIKRGELWSRIAPGDTLSFRLSVPEENRPKLALHIASFQAGYRSLGQGVPDHPYYVQLQLQGQATSTCIENYECDATNANAGPAAATMAIVNGNTGQCTGTLLNDTAKDARNLVLVARHCQNGDGFSEDPDASKFVFYWNAVTPCGQTLGSIYTSGAATTSGATTRVEQVDMWLVEMDSPPPASAQAYFAGWDATGATFSGGYSIHHALGNNKQYVEWYGQPYLAGPVPYSHGGQFVNSYYWDVVNQKGSQDHGSSGAAFFDSNNRVVGSLTAGVASCPANPLQPASASNSSAQITELAYVFALTGDPTSTTGNATIQSFLDPGNTGKQVFDGMAAPQPPPTVSLNGPSSATSGTAFQLNWSTTDATSCTGSGGVNGDGWSGSQQVNGVKNITESVSGQAVKYTLTCTGPGGSQNASVTVQINAAGGGGGSGGGGALPPAVIAGLAAAVLARRRTRAGK